MDFDYFKLAFTFFLLGVGAGGFALSFYVAWYLACHLLGWRREQCAIRDAEQQGVHDVFSFGRRHL
jgi:hypothetical protein